MNEYVVDAQGQHLLQRCTVRVVRKHPFSKNLLFFDVIFCAPSEERSMWSGEEPGSEVNCTKLASLAIKRAEGGDNCDASFPAVVTGDVIVVQRGVVQNVEESIVLKSQRMSILVRPQDITVVDAWDMQRHGFFSFEVGKLNLPAAAEIGVRASFRQPRLAVQCRHHSVDRVLPALQAVCRDIFQERYPLVDIRESSSCFIKSSDRLLLIVDNSPHGDVSQKTLIEALVANPIISPAVMRMYSGDSASALAVAAHPHLQQAMSALRTRLRPLVRSGAVRHLRLHMYPKCMSTDVLAVAAEGDGEEEEEEEDWLSALWQPKTAAHVLSVFLADGVWVAALVRREDLFIGDLRDQNAQPSFAGRALPVEHHDAVCRATAKLSEAFARNGSAVWSAARGERGLTFSFALDVGASPGGWSAFLAQRLTVRTVVSVDRGDLSLPPPWPSAIQHWRLLGQQALDILAALHTSGDAQAAAVQAGVSLSQVEPLAAQRVDLFCCDANIAPGLAVDLLLSAAERGLLLDGAVCVLTLKNIFERRADWQAALAECERRLETGAWTHVQQQHLLANTAKETTLSGIYRAPPAVVSL